MSASPYVLFLVQFALAASWAGESSIVQPRRDRPVENLIQVSWGDQILQDHSDAALNTPERIERSVDNWAGAFGAKTILWRGASYYMERYYEQRTPADSVYRKRVRDITSKFDPLGVARERGKAHGQRMLIYMTILDHGAPHDILYGGTTPFPWQDRLTIEHPELQSVDRRGNVHHGVLELAYPEGRRVMIERILTFIEEFKVDGVYVCTRTHSLPALHADQFGFNPPIVMEMRKRHGVEVMTDARFDYQSRDFAPDHALVEAWRKLRGEYLVQFFRELRAAVPGGKAIYAGIPRGRYLGPPYGNLYLDWESLLQEKLVDGLVLRVTSTKDLHPPLYVPHAKVGYRSSEDDGIGLPSLEDAVNKIYGPVAAAMGIKLFYNTTFYGPRQISTIERSPLLAGVMLWTPTVAPHRAVIAHDDAFCFPGGEMTIDLRLYLNPLPGGHQRILSKYDHQDDATRGWECLVTAEGRFQFKINQVAPQTQKGTDVIVTTPNPLPVEKWLRLACVFDRPKRRMRLYVNGELTAEKTIADQPLRVNSAQAIYLGRNGAWYWHYFSGKIDELKFIAKAVAFEAGGSDRLPPETVANYTFNELSESATVLNSMDVSRHPLRIIGPVDHPLVDADKPFGRALDLHLDHSAKR